MRVNLAPPRAERVKIEMWRADATFLGVKYSVTNKETKREAKMELATQLVQVIDGLGGLNIVTCRGTSSLPARPAHQEGGKLLWELA